MPKERNITRINRNGTNGYQVRVMRGGRMQTKFFARRKFGTLAKALAAAIDYRDALIRFGPAKNQSPVKISSQAGIRCEGQNWVAQWVDENGRRRTRKFSIARYGKLRAEQKAREARMRGVARIDQKEAR